MTTIAVSKSAMACDLQYSHTGGLKFTGGPKCHVLSEEFSQTYYNTPKMILGGCGNADGLAAVWDYVFDADRKKLPKFKEVELVALLANGTIMSSLNMSTWMVIKKPFYAVGSGMQYAIAAMAAGKTPLEACKIASKYDLYTGKGFKEYKL